MRPFVKTTMRRPRARADQLGEARMKRRLAADQAYLADAGTIKERKSVVELSSEICGEDPRRHGRLCSPAKQKEQRIGQIVEMMRLATIGAPLAQETIPSCAHRPRPYAAPARRRLRSGLQPP